ncbi:hypothetical protein VN97_g7847 [Penicillium thymicola]|uniref:Uncharacterized protein n=1 Tax=Penicillium thymicola TaxID=293382 RepID=A0AAI9TEU1_PENTH|nr:hypothetical protein VN97_g7847 [Penicillium thymicola]
MAPSDLDTKLDQLHQNIATWSDSQENVQRRRDLRASALAMAASLSTPEDIFADAFYQPVLAVGILVAMEAQWLQCLSTNTAPLSASKLSEKTNSSRETIFRFMRVLSAHRVVDENCPAEVAANSITHWLTTPAALTGPHLFPQTAEACLRLPSWFTNRKFAEPTSLEDGLFFAIFQKAIR